MPIFDEPSPWIEIAKPNTLNAGREYVSFPVTGGDPGFTPVTVILGLWRLESHLRRAVFSKFPFYPTYALPDLEKRDSRVDLGYVRFGTKNRRGCKPRLLRGGNLGFG